MTQETYNAREHRKKKRWKELTETTQTQILPWHQNDRAPITLSTNFSEPEFLHLFRKMVIIIPITRIYETKLITGQNCLEWSYITYYCQKVKKPESQWNKIPCPNSQSDIMKSSVLSHNSGDKSFFCFVFNTKKEKSIMLISRKKEGYKAGRWEGRKCSKNWKLIKPALQCHQLVY